MKPHLFSQLILMLLLFSACQKKTGPITGSLNLDQLLTVGGNGVIPLYQQRTTQKETGGSSFIFTEGGEFDLPEKRSAGLKSHYFNESYSLPRQEWIK